MSGDYFYDRREWRLSHADHNFMPMWSHWIGEDRYTVRWGCWQVSLIEYDDDV